MIRRIVLSLAFGFILCGLPAVAYETLQKTAETVGPRTALLRLSCDAELSVPWRPRTGFALVDHTVHEWRETRVFWRLAGTQLLRGAL